MARYENGWVKLHRGILKTDIFKNVKCFYIWNYLLLIATYENTSIIHKGKRKKLPPGSCVFSIKFLAEKMDITRKSVKYWLNYLVESERITICTHAKGTLCNITNWEKYQSNEDVMIKKNKQVTQKEYPGNIQVTSGEHLGNIYKESNKTRKKEKKLPEISLDFLNQELTQWTENVSDTIRQKWLDRYHPETISETLQKAKDWSDAKGRDTKNVALLMNTFLKDIEHDAGLEKGSGLTKLQQEGFDYLKRMQKEGLAEQAERERTGNVYAWPEEQGK